MNEVRTQTIRRRRDIGKQRVVIAGGGVAALEAMLALDHMADDALSIVVVCPSGFFEYRPLAVAEPFDNRATPRYDLEALLSTRGARLVRDAVASVDAPARSVELNDGGRLEYDFLLVALGARPLPGVPGATHFWPIGIRIREPRITGTATITLSSSSDRPRWSCRSGPSGPSRLQA